jgi:uncharacterized membrane protein HdeD (DUF308 family)
MTFREAVEEAASWKSILWGILLVILGVAAIASPWAASLGATFVIGCLLIVVGIIHALSAWYAESVGSAVWKVLVGALYFFVGLAIYQHPAWGAAVLTVVVSAVLVTEGVIGVVAYSLLPAMDGDMVWTLLTSIATIILGALIWLQWPSSSVWAIGILLGINLLIVGTTRVVMAFRVRRLIGR